MDPHGLDVLIEAQRQRIAAARVSADGTPSAQAQVREQLDELAASLEELEVVTEEMASQAEQAEATRISPEGLGGRLFEATPAACLVTDLRGIIGWANDEAAELLAVNPRVLQGKPLSVFVSQDSRREFYFQLGLLPDVAKLKGWPLRFSPQGAPDLDAVVGVSMIEGDPPSILWLIVDVSRSRDALDRGRDALARSDIEDLRTRFIADAANALRAPITSLTLMAITLSRHKSEIPDALLEDLLSRLGNSAERANFIVTELFELGQLEERSLAMESVPVRLSDAVDQAVGHIHVRAGASVDARIPEDLVVRADPAWLEQLLTQLLLNALRHGGSAVTIDAGTIDGSVRLSISDDGPGVPDGLVAGMFEPFLRGPGSPGPGLGLSIASRIVHAFGGEINHEPVEPHGARFVVRLQPAS